MGEQMTNLEAAHRAAIVALFSQRWGADKLESDTADRILSNEHSAFRWQAEAAAKAALAAIGMTEAQQQAPCGSLAVVPVVPTREMLKGAYGLGVGCCTVHDDEAVDVWSAMVDAARPGSEG